jgi:hypothetical protein
MRPEDFFQNRFNLNDPETALMFESILDDPERREGLARKLGVWQGHLCEEAAYVRLKGLHPNLIQHPNGQRNAPDFLLEDTAGHIYWIEHKNCDSSKRYSEIKNNKVPLNFFKHSHRRPGSTVADLCYEDKSDERTTYVLAVCTFPLTKEFTWSFSAYRDLPENSLHPGKVATTLWVPIDPTPDDTWTTDLNDIINRKDLK